MTKSFYLLIALLILFELEAQEVPVSVQQQIENLGDIVVAGEQELEQFQKQPLNLNTASIEELKQLMISDEQIKSLISYRNMLGQLLSIYELQAVPGWDLITIRRIIPYISIEVDHSIKDDFLERIKNGVHSFLIRTAFNPGQKNEFNGADYNLFFRYRYQYKNLLQFGISGEKDAGEQFFAGTQKAGFDFYSMHCFLRNNGIFKAIAVGDFTVNLGQGLIHWQSLAFKKSSDPTMIKRNSEILKPYSSAGEYNFHRGIGATLQWRLWETTLFVSLRSLDATIEADTVDRYFTSIRQSGYHRTNSELNFRRSLQQFTAGYNLRYKKENWRLGLNLIHHLFDLPKKKGELPYQFYDISGRSWSNVSVDYTYNYKNLFCFGELATDQKIRPALVNGMLIALDKKLDLYFVHRSLNRGYQTLYGNAFTENSNVGNENGLYTGIRFNPYNWLRLDCYTDFFKFPWLKFGADSPTSGSEYLLQVSLKPGKEIEINTRYRINKHQVRVSQNIFLVNINGEEIRRDWRMTIHYKMNTNVTLQGRVDISWYKHQYSMLQHGFQAYMDFHWKNLLPGIAMRLRVQSFDTEGYDTRIYTYENDLASFSAPQFSGKGYLYYTLIQYKIKKILVMGIRWRYIMKYDVNENIIYEQQDKKHEIKCLIQYYI